jgi:hypothetical protein
LVGSFGLQQGVQHRLRDSLAVEVEHVVGAHRVGLAGVFDVVEDHIVGHVGLGEPDDFLQIRRHAARGGLGVGGAVGAEQSESQQRGHSGAGELCLQVRVPF